MKQKTACKMKTVLFAIIFLFSLYLLGSSLRILFYGKDISHLVNSVVYAFAFYHSGPPMVKNALLAGWIEFMEEGKDTGSKQVKQRGREKQKAPL